MKRLKVIVSAYTCSPYHGSEPAVGWGYVSALSKYHDLWVIVEEEKWKKPIEQYLNENPEFGERVKFYFLPKKRNRFLRKLWPPSYYWYYRKWHVAAYHLAQKLNAEVKFDLAHQLTIVSFREQGYLWKMGIPFVWGPVGGMGLFPWHFIHRVGLYGAVFFTVRNLINSVHMRFLRRPKIAARIAGNGLISATSEIHEGMRRFYGCDSAILSEVGLPPQNPVQYARRSQKDPLRIIWSGLNIPRKALPLGMQALTSLPQNLPWELHMLGDGPLNKKWQTEADRLGLSKKIHFHGRLPRDIALQTMQNGHVMLITSLSDLTSTVTIEALANGLPVICPDHCGFQDAITPECGIRVSVQSPKQMIQELSAAIQKLAEDEPFRQKLAHGALERAKLYDWSRKGELMNEIYQKVINEEDSDYRN